MASNGVTDATDTAPNIHSGDGGGHKSPSKDKVPRPPNAFIIYRKEWHPKVLMENVSFLSTLYLQHATDESTGEPSQQ